MSRPDILPSAVDDATSFVVDVSFGGTGNSADLLSEVRALAVDSRGRVIVSDPKERAVRVFDSAGTALRTLGREGSGPGEFRRVNGIRVDEHDNIYLYDPRQQRLLVFDSTGSAASTLSVGGYSFGGHWDGGIDHEGRLVDQQVRANPTLQTLVRRRDLKSGDEEWFPYRSCKVDALLIEHPYGMLGVPYGAEELQWIDIARGGTWCASTRDSVLYFTPFRDTIPSDSLRVQLKAAPVTPAERDTAIAQARRQVPPDFDLSVVINTIPLTKPALRMLNRDDEGTLWLLSREASGDALHAFNEQTHSARRYEIRGSRVDDWFFVIRSRTLWFVSWNSDGLPVINRATLRSTSGEQ